MPYLRRDLGLALRSSSVRAIALRLGNSLPYTDTSRLVPRPFFTLDPYDWERVLITQCGSTVACRASGSRYALGPYNTVDPSWQASTPAPRLFQSLPHPDVTHMHIALICAHARKRICQVTVARSVTVIALRNPENPSL